MDDLISRQAVLKQLADRIEAAKKWHEDCVAFENETGEQASYRALMDFNEVRLMVENLPSAQPEPRWIPVTERLPLVTYDEHGNHSSEPVILCMESGEIEIGFFNPVGTFESADDDGLSVIGSIHAGTVDYKHVVAWMPFPEPYERSENDS